MTADTKNDWLQVLRAVAALMVLLFHARILWHDSPLLGATQSLFRWGFVGVDIFFVLSGYVVWKSADRLDFQARRFMVRRGFRVYLGYWAALLLLVAVYALSGNLGKLPAEHAVGSILLLHIGLEDNWLATAWSLPYELYFYIWVALLCALLPQKQRGFALVGLFLMLAAWTVWCAVRLPQLVAQNAQPLLFLATPMGLQFLVGALVARYQKYLPTDPRRIAATAAGVCAVGMVLATAGFSWGTTGSLYDQILVYRAISFGWVGVGFLLAALAASMLKLRANVMLVSIGDASYSLYLLHPVLLKVVRGLMSHIPADSLWHIPLAPATVVAIVWACMQWYRWIEKPLYERACQWAIRPTPHT